MSRILTTKEAKQRRNFSRKAMKIEEAMNKLIADGYESGFPPDVSIWVTPEARRPVVKIWFFRDSDSIQNE
ncbi:MAG: hypothetical protein AB1325_02615 [Nitrospirota bacterium]